MANKHMKSYSILLLMRELHIKITMRYHYTPINYQTGQNPEHGQHQMLVKVWSNRNSHSLLMGMPNGTATQEDNMGYYIYLFWLCWIFVAVHRLLIVLASLTEGHRLYGTGASAVVTHRLVTPRHKESSQTRD